MVRGGQTWDYGWEYVACVVKRICMGVWGTFEVAYFVGSLASMSRENQLSP